MIQRLALVAIGIGSLGQKSPLLAGERKWPDVTVAQLRRP